MGPFDYTRRGRRWRQPERSGLERAYHLWAWAAIVVVLAIAALILRALGG